MFTDRFIELTIPLYNKDEAEIIGYNSQSKVNYKAKCKINPFEISHYRECVNDDDETLSHVLVYFKGGQNYEFDISIKEFEKILNDHQQ